jgi:hypothetical protein
MLLKYPIGQKKRQPLSWLDGSNQLQKYIHDMATKVTGGLGKVLIPITREQVLLLKAGTHGRGGGLW